MAALVSFKWGGLISIRDLMGFPIQVSLKKCHWISENLYFACVEGQCVNARLCSRWSISVYTLENKEWCVCKLKILDDPSAIVYRLCNMINLWMILQKDQWWRSLEEGGEMSKVVIWEAYSRSHGWISMSVRLMNWFLVCWFLWSQEKIHHALFFYCYSGCVCLVGVVLLVSIDLLLP
jgi:hypothetical protein